MRRAERQKARQQGRRPKALQEVDFLLGVTDISRSGALRFKLPGDTVFQSPSEEGVPGFVRLASLLASSRRIEQGVGIETDLHTILAPGSSLGGARPKASVVDPEGNLAIAKFPKVSDEYSLETWEHIALLIAGDAGIVTPRHELLRISERPVLLSWRFDRQGVVRIPFLSAMSMLQARDGERRSYPEIVDELAKHGGNAKKDAAQLFRRMVFNILVSNVDDHLRNHGFLWSDLSGWVLSPAYDLNPTPSDLKARVLATSISLDEGTCSLELALDQSELFGLSLQEANVIVADVAKAVSQWRLVASRIGETNARIERMASAFEHEDLELGLRTVP